jgi:hypothetical protein
MRDEARTPSVSCGIDCRTNLSFQSRPKLCPLSILSLHTPLKFFFISSFLLFFGWQMLLFLNLNRTNNIFPKKPHTLEGLVCDGLSVSPKYSTLLFRQNIFKQKLSGTCTNMYRVFTRYLITTPVGAVKFI